MPQFNQQKLDKLKKIDKYLSIFWLNRIKKDRYALDVSDINISIIGFFLIGDTIMYLPSLRAIRNNYPNSNITLICTKVVQTVLADQNIADNFVIVDCPWIAPFNKSPKNIIKFFSSIYTVNKKVYDLCIDFRGDWRNIFYMNFVHSKRKVSYISSGGEYMLTDPIQPKDDIVHYTSEGLYLLKQLGLAIDKGAEFPKLIVTDYKNSLIKSFQLSYGLNNKKVVGLHPGVSASVYARKWDDSRFAEVVNRLHAADNSIVFIFFQGPNEAQTIENIKNKLDVDVRTHLVKESLPRYMALLNVCDLLICNDSGAGHLASAYDIPSIVIFGKADPAAVKPMGKNVSIISHDLDCKPCNQHICPLGTNECIKSITTDEVFATVSEVLKTIK